MLKLGCWNVEPKERPSFADILVKLEKISVSFSQTPHDSFQTLQDDWKREITEALEDLKLKECVSIKPNFLLQIFLDLK